MGLGSDYKLIDVNAKPDPESEDGSLPAGVYTTIAAAVSDGGGTIVLLPGVYEECLLIENGEKIMSARAAKEALGDGAEDLPETDAEVDAVISGTSFHTISFLGEGELEDVTIRQSGPGKWFAVLCTGGGAPTLTSCKVDGATSSCVAVTEGASPTLAKCVISGSHAGAGVCVFGGGKAVLTECEIRDNAKSGVECTGEESEVTMENNNVFKNRGDGVLIMEQAKGTLTTNNIHNNYHCGVEVRDQGGVTATENTLNSNNFGVMIARTSSGTLENNKICGNFITGVEISRCDYELEEEELPQITNNVISNNLESGLKLWHRAAATLSANTIEGNLEEVKITPRSRRHTRFGEAEEGEVRGMMGNNKVRELKDILNPPEEEPPTEEAEGGGEDGEEEEGGEEDGE